MCYIVRYFTNLFSNVLGISRISISWQFGHPLHYPWCFSPFRFVGNIQSYKMGIFNIFNIQPSKLSMYNACRTCICLHFYSSNIETFGTDTNWRAWNILSLLFKKNKYKLQFVQLIFTFNMCGKNNREEEEKRPSLDQSYDDKWLNWEGKIGDNWINKTALLCRKIQM